MPAGLDGNPEPVVTRARSKVLDHCARAVLSSLSDSGRTVVAIDGRPGAGKSTFADELATRLESEGFDTVRSTTDSFHRPLAQRMQRGTHSSDGYYLDSHQLDTIVSELLEPFASGAPSVRVAAFDEPSDKEVREFAVVDGPAVLIFDGLFLQRPKLAPSWNLPIYLLADARLDERWLSFLLTDLPEDPSARSAMLDERLERARWPRYRQGWQRYVSETEPASRAAIVVDNNDFAAPFVRS